MKQFHSSALSVWLNGLLYLSPFVFPLYLIRFQVYGIPVTFLEGYIYLFFGLFLISLFSGVRTVRWDKPARWYYGMAFILLLGATLGVVTAPHFMALPSGVLMDSQRAALGVWKGWVLAPILYFFVLTQVADSPQKVRRLLLTFVYSAGLVALVSYGYAVFGTGMTYDLRLSGFFESANYLSLYIVPALLLGIYFVLSPGEITKRDEYLNLASVTIMTHALFLTQSYAAVIGVFGALAFFIVVLLLRKRSNFLKMLIAFIVLFFTFVLILAAVATTPKFRQFVDFENRSSSSVRLEIYEVAWQLVNDYPLTGVGPGLFQGYYQIKGPGYLEKAPMEWNIPHPHNVFLAFWLNAGLLGLLALLGLIVLAHFRLTYPLIALWGILIHGLFDTPFWKNDLAVIFWLVVGAILILQTYGTDSTKGGKAPVRRRLAPKRSKSAKAKTVKPKER